MERRMVLLFALLTLGCNKPQNDKPNPVMDNSEKAPPKKSAYAERRTEYLAHTDAAGKTALQIANDNKQEGVAVVLKKFGAK